MESKAFGSIAFLIITLLLCGTIQLAICRSEEISKEETMKLGGWRDREQVVAGTMYHLTLEANEGGQTKNFEAKVWVKPWMNFKQLQEFTESST
ncbi:hypothetical protein EUTSA_v10023901mg [Eutrema salsugineum]|uniref:Cysteine proteinase inhibitor n=1 Tax=Eutrema salsugineum TaxID=72664 RepID=V4JVF6_EUTSA|nr:hypothetical protein EUTSA_v10023901mg [Eutrema salsugineum]